MALTVPVYSDLSLVYDSPEGVQQRYKDICAAFEKSFGSAPEALARAPGRVNLIGEHIDYEGYGVLPMAITQDTIVAIKRGGTSLEVTSMLPDKYPAKTFDTDPNQAVDVGHHSWANYFMCAYKGVYELLEAKHGGAPEPTGLQVLVHGVVPTGSGLSSSAAFICSCMLAILAAYGKLPLLPEDSSSCILKADVAAFAARAEQSVGVSCGGMDQAISMMGMKGVAMKVDFNPVRAQDVSLPPGLTFVVANSLSVSNKAVGAHRRYNMRVVECRLAAMLLALGLGHDKASVTSKINTLRDVEPLIEAKYGSTDKAVQAVQDCLHEGLYSLEEIEGSLGAALSKLYSDSAVALKVLEAGLEDGGFRLRNRALHVYQEAARVHAFKAVCDRTDLAAEAKALELGALMDASHASCSAAYECSCAELDELVAAAKECGALGARLTGAGWGGCSVFLVRDSEVDSFMAGLSDKYFTSSRKSVAPELDMASILFASKPSAGAAVLYLEGLTAPCSAVPSNSKAAATAVVA